MLGEVCSLAAALSWAIGLILFKKSDAIRPVAMNFFKNTVGLGLLGLTMLAMGEGFAFDRSAHDWTLLVVSGLLGIALADTLTFAALHRLGPGLLAVVDCTYAPSIVLLSILFLGESLSAGLAIGGGLVLGGVLIAVLEHGRDASSSADGRARRLGVIYGVAGIVTMGFGVMASKPILERSSLIEVTTVRLAAGVLGQVLWVACVPRDREALRVFRRTDVLATLIPATIFGTYVSMILWLGGFKWTTASHAAVLNQVSTVFTILLARVFLAEAITRQRALGAGLALVGAVIVLLDRR